MSPRGSTSGTGAVVVDALRTPIGTAGHGLAAVSADRLAAPVLAALVERCPAPARVVDVLLGNCMGPGGDVARVATLRAGLELARRRPDAGHPGWGVDVPATTVDRQCASGLAAVTLGVALLRGEPAADPTTGAATVVLAGGVESASTAPWRSWPPTAIAGPQRYERAPFAPAELGDPDMGWANDLLAERWAVTRAEQDAYAVGSHLRAVATQGRGGFDAEIVPVAGVSADERPRPGLTTQRLARLPAAFREQGTVTAGNSCGVNDGAAAVTLVGEQTRSRWGAPGLRVLATATAALDPAAPGEGLVPATRAALARAGLGVGDLDAVELNEAFAGQVIACCRALDLDPARVCPDGGALALGHPWGASGAVLVVRLFSRLVREEAGRYGLAAVAAGGGQGVAVVVEAVR